MEETKHHIQEQDQRIQQLQTKINHLTQDHEELQEQHSSEKIKSKQLNHAHSDLEFELS